MRKLWDRLKRWWRAKHRVMLVNYETYAQTRSITYTNGKLTSVVVGALLLAFGLGILLVFVTPLRELTPGYTDTELKTKYAELQQVAVKLEAEIANRDSLFAGLQRLSGIDPSTLPPESGASAPVAAAPQPQPAPQPTPQPTPAPATADAHNHDHNHDHEATPPADVKQAMNMAGVFASAKDVDNSFARGFIFQPPIDLKSAKLVKGYKPQELHYALDYAAPAGSIIYSVADGYVVYAEYSLTTGYVIGVYHRNGMLSFYKHNSLLLKKVGNYVFAGEAIAVIGNSGEASTGPHLHFELWSNGFAVDPTTYILQP